VWKIVSESAVSKVFEYCSPGRRYVLSISYYFSGQEVKILLIVLEGNKKRYAFLSIDDLKMFLSKRNVPMPPLGEEGDIR
jgi:hypothetical protein